MFLIYIDDLNQTKNFCKFHHFTDDTNLRHFSKSVNKLNKYVNLDFKNLAYWLNADKIFTECEKTELVTFKHQIQILDSPIKINFIRKSLYPAKSVKYVELMKI